jgi:hypothetical protein
MSTIIPHPIAPEQIVEEDMTLYKLWDGEVLATVFISKGCHGFYSAAIVVEYNDSPIKTLSYDGYDYPAPPKANVFEWVAKELNDLAIPKGSAQEMSQQGCDIELCEIEMYVS